MGRLDNRQIERILGQQYAQVLKESNGTSIWGRAVDEEDIQGSLDLLQRYNKISLALRSRGGAKVFI